MKTWGTRAWIIIAACGRGLPEVIYAAGKTPEQTVAIFSQPGGVTASMCWPLEVDEATARGGAGAAFPEAQHSALARTVTLPGNVRRCAGTMAVLCAGTSDLPVSPKRPAITAELFGAKVSRLYDVGVAGLHRSAERAGGAA